MIKLGYKFLILSVLLFMVSNVEAQNSANIQFQVSFTEPQAHYADVQMTINNIKKNELIVKMPVWTPGSYLIREFSKNIESFGVKSMSDKALDFEKINKNYRIKNDSMAQF